MENTPQVDRTADPLMIAEGWLKEGRNVAIATVVAETGNFSGVMRRGVEVVWA